MNSLCGLPTLRVLWVERLRDAALAKALEEQGALTLAAAEGLDDAAARLMSAGGADIDAVALDAGGWKGRIAQAAATLAEAAPALPLLILAPSEQMGEAGQVVQAGLAQDALCREGLDPRVAAYALRFAQERKRADQAFSQGEQRLADFLDAASDWYYETGPDHRFTVISQRFYDLTGMPVGSCIGRRRIDCAAPETLAAQPEKWRRHEEILATHEPYRDFDYVLAVPDGGRRHLRISGKPVFGPGGAFLGYRGIGTNITDATEARDRARDAQARLYEAIENVSEGFVLWDTDDRLVLCNSRFRRLHAAIAHRLLPGTTFAEFIALAVGAGTLAQAASDPDGWMKSRLASHRHPTQAFEIRIEDKWIQIREHHNADGSTIGIYTDITETKRAERALRDSEEAYALAMRAANEVLWAWSIPEDEAYISPRLKTVLNIELEEKGIPGREWVLRIHPEDRAAREDAFRAHLKGETDFFQCEYRVRESGGGYRWVLDRGLALRDGKGRATRMAGSFSDITERRRYEAALREAKEQAELASRAKSDFLANMSHELRTPLNAIIGFSDVMRSQIFGPITCPQYEDYVTAIHESGIHLLKVINDILDVSKIEANRFDLRDEDVDVAEAIQSSLRLIRERAGNNNIAVDAHTPEAIPRLRADERRLKQILINLLSNAVKFTPPGGQVGIRVRLDEAGGMHFEIHDSGIGIAPEDLAKVLSPFGQVDSTLGRRFEGTGLGLPLAKGLVELHGGSLVIQSRVGQGTRIQVCFPPERVLRRTAAF